MTVSHCSGVEEAEYCSGINDEEPRYECGTMLCCEAGCWMPLSYEPVEQPYTNKATRDRDGISRKYLERNGSSVDDAPKVKRPRPGTLLDCGRSC